MQPGVGNPWQPHCVLFLQQGSARKHAGHRDATHKHAPPSQLCPLPHTYVEPQPPQLFGSLVSSTHEPLQSACPAGQSLAHE